MNGFSKLLTGAAIGALLIGSANAADILGNGSLKDDAPAGGGGVVNWTGFYIGGQVGYGNANHNLSVQSYSKDTCVTDPEGYNIPSGTGDAFSFHTFSSGGDCPLYDHDSDTTTAGKQSVLQAGESEELATLDGLNSHGVFGGVQAGYDWSRGRLLFGLFGDYQINNMETKGSVSIPMGNMAFGLEKQDEWSAGVRVGYIAAPRTLVYALAAFTQTEYDVTGVPAKAGPYKIETGATFTGVSVGGGVELAVANNVFLGVEYRHTFYGAEDILNGFDRICNDGFKLEDELDEDKIMATLKIKFNGFGFSD